MMLKLKSLRQTVVLSLVGKRPSLLNHIVGDSLNFGKQDRSKFVPPARAPYSIDDFLNTTTGAPVHSLVHHNIKCWGLVLKPGSPPRPVLLHCSASTTSQRTAYQLFVLVSASWVGLVSGVLPLALSKVSALALSDLPPHHTFVRSLITG